MKKTLYSLILSDEVIHEIDLLAHRMGTSRSNLVNNILAEHVKLQTPEKRTSDIFSAIEELMATSRELVPMLTQGAPTMALRSCLEYKYRPTVRYEVYVSSADDQLGTLSVVFRTTSAALLESLGSFFRLWKRIEDSLLGYERIYTLDDGRFTRSLCSPLHTDGSPASLTSHELAEIISDYIRLFDRLMKAYIAGTLDGDDIAREYVAELKKQTIHI